MKTLNLGIVDFFILRKHFHFAVKTITFIAILKSGRFLETSDPELSIQHIVDDDFIILGGRNWKIKVKTSGIATNFTHFCCFDPRFWLEKGWKSDFWLKISNLHEITIRKPPLIVDFWLIMSTLWTIEKLFQGIIKLYFRREDYFWAF